MSGIEYITVRELTHQQKKDLSNIKCIYTDRGRTCTGCCMEEGPYCLISICSTYLKTNNNSDNVLDIKICKARLLKHRILI